jgi:hypothetical protein
LVDRFLNQSKEIIYLLIYLSQFRPSVIFQLLARGESLEVKTLITSSRCVMEPSSSHEHPPLHPGESGEMNWPKTKPDEAAV